MKRLRSLNAAGFAAVIAQLLVHHRKRQRGQQVAQLHKVGAHEAQPLGGEGVARLFGVAGRQVVVVRAEQRNAVEVARERRLIRQQPRAGVFPLGVLARGGRNVLGITGVHARVQREEAAVGLALTLHLLLGGQHHRADKRAGNAVGRRHQVLNDVAVLPQEVLLRVAVEVQVYHARRKRLVLRVAALNANVRGLHPPGGGAVHELRAEVGRRIVFAVVALKPRRVVVEELAQHAAELADANGSGPQVGGVEGVQQVTAHVAHADHVGFAQVLHRHGPDKEQPVVAQGQRMVQAVAVGEARPVQEEARGDVVTLVRPVPLPGEVFQPLLDLLFHRPGRNQHHLQRNVSGSDVAQQILQAFGQLLVGTNQRLALHHKAHRLLVHPDLAFGVVILVGQQVADVRVVHVLQLLSRLVRGVPLAQNARHRLHHVQRVKAEAFQKFHADLTSECRSSRRDWRRCR